MLNIDHFWVIAVCSNPVRFKRRWELFKEFEEHIKDLGGRLLVVEQAFGRREPQLPRILGHSKHKYDDKRYFDEDDWKKKDRHKKNEHEDHHDDDNDDDDNDDKKEKRHNRHRKTEYLILRTNQELWHKENMINAGITYLTQVDPEWKYVAWIDADVHFQRRDVILETAQQLQHYDLVQMFSHVVDMGPEFEPVNQYNGFMYCYQQNDFQPPIGAGDGGYYADTGFWHPGYAWAANRKAMEKLCLFDQAILGAGDHHMALCLIGQGKKSLPGNISKGYREAVLEWERIALHEYRRNIGYVPGLITHHWHGKKKNRKYIERWKIITDCNFNPAIDLIRDNQGLYRLNMTHGQRSERLRDKIREYFRHRNEDSIDLE